MQSVEIFVQCVRFHRHMHVETEEKVCQGGTRAQCRGSLKVLPSTVRTQLEERYLNLPPLFLIVY